MCGGENVICTHTKISSTTTTGSSNRTEEQQQQQQKGGGKLITYHHPKSPNYRHIRDKIHPIFAFC